MSCTCSNTGHNAGSRWPTMGVSIACKTRGCTLLGPGPSKIRFGTCTACPEVCMAVCPPLQDGSDGGGRRLEGPRAHGQDTFPRVRPAATVPGSDQREAPPGRLEAHE